MMMSSSSQSTTPRRRVIIGPNATRESHVFADVELDPAVAMPPFVVTELWKVPTIPTPIPITDDGCEGEWDLEPLPTGCTVRWVEFRPDSEWKSPDSENELGDAGEVIAEDGFHQTETLDLVVVVEGEIWCELEDGEVHLKKGDTLVQPGTNHAWSVRTEEPCLTLAVLVKGKH